MRRYDNAFNVAHQWDEIVSGSDVQMTPVGNRVVLRHVNCVTNKGDGTNDFLFTFKSGGSSGTTEMQFRPANVSGFFGIQSGSVNHVFNVPGGGIVFDEGINLIGTWSASTADFACYISLMVTR